MVELLETYTVNCLNQYTSISSSAPSASPRETFAPRFDDGNQTLVKTATGLWTVSFDAENRPVSWANDVTNIVMTYDRLCRRISKSDVRLVYKDFLQVCDNLSNVTIWDPTEPAATRPLISDRGANASYYVHDGGKNVCGVVSPDGNVLAHNISISLKGSSSVRHSPLSNCSCEMAMAFAGSVFPWDIPVFAQGLFEGSAAFCESGDIPSLRAVDDARRFCYNTTFIPEECRTNHRRSR